MLSVLYFIPEVKILKHQYKKEFLIQNTTYTMRMVFYFVLKVLKPVKRLFK